MRVSVIIAVLNAADTLARSVNSLRAQTFRDWEGIIVDDGSSDGTLDLARELAAEEPRLRVVPTPHGGLSAARNRGIAEASSDWLLFFDGDDRLDPNHLSRLTEALLRAQGADVAYCGMSYVDSNERVIHQEFIPLYLPPFEMFGRRCIHDVHAAVVRKSLVEAVGCFDTTLRNTEDWDLWSRLARSGARYTAVAEFLAETWVRRGSMSQDAWAMFDGMMTVVERNHSVDERVPNPLPKYAGGLPSADLPAARLLTACWVAGIRLGQGEDPRAVLEKLPDEPGPSLDPMFSAHLLITGAVGSARVRFDELLARWSEFGPKVEAYFEALEAKSRSRSLARCAQRHAERLVLEKGAGTDPVTAGRFFGTGLPLDQPLRAIKVPDSCDRVIASVGTADGLLGSLELPSTEGAVEADLLARASSREFAWEILERFFRHTLYPSLRVERGPREVSFWRGPNRFGPFDLENGVAPGGVAVEGVGPESVALASLLHAGSGWTVFLQELWGRPDWPHDRFYDFEFEEAASKPHRVKKGRVRIEVSQELPHLKVSGRDVEVTVAVGGEDVGVVQLPVGGGLLRSHELRVVICLAAGFELCRAAVARGLVGSSLEDTTPLRERLAAAARRAGPKGLGAGDQRTTRGGLGAAAVQPAIRQEPRRLYAPQFTPQEGLIGRILGARKDAGSAPEKVPEVYTHDLPILMYHQVETGGGRARDIYSVTPERFEEQLAYLRKGGYESANLAELAQAVVGRQPLPGTRVMLTFDDGFEDFLTEAWPLLQKYGFQASVYLVSDLVGKTNAWDAGVRTEAPLLSWNQIRDLATQGVEFGAHSATHPRLSSLESPQVREELTRSRTRIQEEVESDVSALAYPHGDADPCVHHWARNAGYEMAFTTNRGPFRPGTPALAIPRIGVFGTDTLEDFVEKLPVLRPPSPLKNSSRGDPPASTPRPQSSA